ncbi:uncharacterized protein LOC134288950 [Aedes albopictus]|uniref:Uncharacterized protein n=1 Tax=Aedes albopictus TaxID=7160 RepID=A0ABM1XMA2_AEDAL
MPRLTKKRKAAISAWIFRKKQINSDSDQVRSGPSSEPQDTNTGLWDIGHPEAKIEDDSSECSASESLDGLFFPPGSLDEEIPSEPSDSVAFGDSVAEARLVAIEDFSPPPIPLLEECDLIWSDFPENMDRPPAYAGNIINSTPPSPILSHNSDPVPVVVCPFDFGPLWRISPERKTENIGSPASVDTSSAASMANLCFVPMSGEEDRNCNRQTLSPSAPPTVECLQSNPIEEIRVISTETSHQSKDDQSEDTAVSHFAHHRLTRSKTVIIDIPGRPHGLSATLDCYCKACIKNAAVEPNPEVLEERTAKSAQPRDDSTAAKMTEIYASFELPKTSRVGKVGRPHKSRQLSRYCKKWGKIGLLGIDNRHCRSIDSRRCKKSKTNELSIRSSLYG